MSKKSVKTDDLIDDLIKALQDEVAQQKVLLLLFCLCLRNNS